MQRILNTSARPIKLSQGNVEVKLPIGGFCDLEKVKVDELLKNHVIEAMVGRGLVMISEGALKREIPLKKESSEKEMPERFKPKDEKAEFGSASPDKAKIETISVEAKETKTKGKRVTAKDK